MWNNWAVGTNDRCPNKYTEEIQQYFQDKRNSGEPPLLMFGNYIIMSHGMSVALQNNIN